MGKIENEDNGLKEGTPGLRKYSIVFLILGIIGLVATIIIMINTYKNSANANELVKPLIYGFIPFIIFFALLRIGIKGLSNK